MIYGYASRRSQLIPVIFPLILIRLPPHSFSGEFFMASAIRKILLKKGINAAGKSGLGFIFDGRDKMRIYKNCQKRFVSLGVYNISNRVLHSIVFRTMFCKV